MLEGLHIPLTTPFAPDGRVALPKLAANVARYSKTPAAGLIVLGPSAEPTLLSDDETRDVLSTAANAAAPEKVLLAGIARDSVRSVLALADFAAQHHYDAILLAPPTALGEARRSQQRHNELLLFFQAVADRSPLPIVLARTGMRSSLSEIFPAIAAHPNVIGSLYCSPSRLPSIHKYGVSRLLEQTVPIKREVPVTSTFAAVTARMKLAAEARAPASLVSAGFAHRLRNCHRRTACSHLPCARAPNPSASRSSAATPLPCSTPSTPEPQASRPPSPPARRRPAMRSTLHGRTATRRSPRKNSNASAKLPPSPNPSAPAASSTPAT